MLKRQSKVTSEQCCGENEIIMAAAAAADSREE
jgi:hypothetical protein